MPSSPLHFFTFLRRVVTFYANVARQWRYNFVILFFVVVLVNVICDIMMPALTEEIKNF